MTNVPARPQPQESESVYTQLGGLPTLARVHKIFYDKLYAHPWLKQFFAGVAQQLIEDQQSDFMAQAMGGPDRYCGKLPVPAHKHMYITAELFDARHALLAESLREARVPEEAAARWLRIDAAFKGRLVKNSPSECAGRFKTEPIIVVPKPDR